MPDNADGIRTGWLNFYRDVLLVLYPVLAAGFAVLRPRVWIDGCGLRRPSSAADLFFRGALRVYDFIRFRPSGGSGPAISVYAQPLGLMCHVAMQVAFLASCVALAVLLAVPLRALALPKASRAILLRWVALASLLVWLGSWWRLNPRVMAGVGPVCLWCGYEWWRLEAVLLLVGTAIVAHFVFRLKPAAYLAILAYGVFFLLHFGFWSLDVVNPVFWWPFVLVSVATAARGAFWLSRGSKPMGDGAQAESRAMSRMAMLVIALASLSILLLIWLPRRPYSISRSKEIKSLVIRLARGGGLGAAPSYSITIHGDGKVEYAGRWRVGVKGSRTALIRPDQVRELAEKFDHSGFFEVDGRTFGWVCDSSVATILVSVEGREHQVSVTGVGIPETEQVEEAEVWKLAQEIDRTVNSDQWTRCDPPCRR